jgi:hypothetical protein
VIESPKIPASPNKNFCLKGGRWWFCGESIREAFSIPVKATAIQFRAFKKPAPGRWEIVRDRYGRFDFDFWRVRFEGEGESKSYIIEDCTELDIFKLLGKRRKTWYVDVYYWVGGKSLV